MIVSPLKFLRFSQLTYLIYICVSGHGLRDQTPLKFAIIGGIGTKFVWQVSCPVPCLVPRLLFIVTGNVFEHDQANVVQFNEQKILDPKIITKGQIQNEIETFSKTPISLIEENL